MTSDASRYEEAQNVLEKSEDAVERSRAVEALADDLSTMCVHDLLDSLEAATEEEEVERHLVRLVREFPLADAGIWAYRPVSPAADASIVEAWRTHLRTNPSFDALCTALLCFFQGASLLRLVDTSGRRERERFELMTGLADLGVGLVPPRETNDAR